MLSGNRNFEARIHPNIRANFLASPPLVVAYAIAGTMLVDLMTEPLGKGAKGEDVWIGDIWPTSQEIYDGMKFAMDPKTFRSLYGRSRRREPDVEGRGTAATGQVYTWPTLDLHRRAAVLPGLQHATAAAPATSAARASLGIFGDSITTDHISPGRLHQADLAGRDLPPGARRRRARLQPYGARRSNHEVMMRGTFANVRIRNLMVPPKPDGARVEGGVHGHQPTGEQLPIYDAAMKYAAAGTPLLVFGGEEYGTGSSRDWAAKGTQLLGVKAVVARSFERIHRSQPGRHGRCAAASSRAGTRSQSLGIKGDEEFDVIGPRGRPASRSRT